MVELREIFRPNLFIIVELKKSEQEQSPEAATRGVL